MESQAVQQSRLNGRRPGKDCLSQHGGRYSDFIHDLLASSGNAGPIHRRNPLDTHTAGIHGFGWSRGSSHKNRGRRFQSALRASLNSHPATDIAGWLPWKDNTSREGGRRCRNGLTTCSALRPPDSRSIEQCVY